MHQDYNIVPTSCNEAPSAQHHNRSMCVMCTSIMHEKCVVSCARASTVITAPQLRPNKHTHHRPPQCSLANSIGYSSHTKSVTKGYTMLPKRGAGPTNCAYALGTSTRLAYVSFSLFRTVTSYGGKKNDRPSIFHNRSATHAPAKKVVQIVLPILYRPLHPAGGRIRVARWRNR